MDRALHHEILEIQNLVKQIDEALAWGDCPPVAEKDEKIQEHLIFLRNQMKIENLQKTENFQKTRFFQKSKISQKTQKIQKKPQFSPILRPKYPEMYDFLENFREDLQFHETQEHEIAEIQKDIKLFRRQIEANFATLKEFAHSLTV